MNYDIEVQQNGTEKGVKELIVDGQKFEGSVIPFDASKKGETVNVTVVM